ncbi:hypothetical protein EV182_002178 [Spiromyces aspiralis]|uniref:Uncharacterized protein n=1 Tax=Spiromyces aspiralis TaxID=68401 RepID=A0ACC1HVN5_9FUNG|nr:hypothetical protein EV182_002178 [Spiromyces aspiralis]
MVVQVQDHMATLLAGLRARHNLRVRGQAVGEDLLKFLDGEVVKICERIELTTREGARGHSDSSGDDSSSSISGGSSTAQATRGPSRSGIRPISLPTIYPPTSWPPCPRTSRYTKSTADCDKPPPLPARCCAEL